MWVKIQQNGQVLWQVRKWRDWTWLRHGFSTCSSGNLVDSFDRQLNFSETFSFPLPWVTGQQVHGNRIVQVYETYPERYEGTDGLYTSIQGLMLASFYADCVPLLFVDPVARVVGTAHAGWRGTKKQIGVHMVRSLVESFHSNPDHIEVGIGPSIGPCCFTVSQDVAEFFPRSITSSSEPFKYQLDLWHENFIQLTSAGISKKNIHLADVCTCCSHEFFSYRREKTHNRMAALIGLD